MENTQLDKNQVEMLDGLTVDGVAQAAAVRVEDEVGLTKASILLQGIKGLLRQVDGVFSPPTKATHAAWKSILAARKKVEGPILDAERVVKVEVGRYHGALEAAALKARRDAEAKARAEEEERRLAEAIEAEKRGMSNVADAILDAPPEPVQVVVPPTPPAPRVAGISTRKGYKAKVVDIEKFVRFALENKEWFYLVDIDQAALNACATRYKEELELPGITLVVSTVVSSRQ